MFCDAYIKSLTEAATGGRELSSTLQRHLASCSDCRFAFAEEQSLFAAIEAGLHSVANAEIPATLIPRVHVALNNEPAERKRSLRFFVWGLSGAASLTAIVLGLLYLPPKHGRLAVAPIPTPVVVSKNPATTTLVNSAQPGGVSHLQRGKLVGLVATKYSEPEQPKVLVQPDEGIALRRYEEFLRKKSARAILVASAGSLDMPQGIEPLQIKEIEITVLSKSYAEGDLK